MHKNTWPLVLFTLLAQAGTGTYLVMRVSQWLTGNGYHGLASLPDRKILVITFVLLLLSLAFSFFHLGIPQNAIYALSNTWRSWLSREILFLCLFLSLLSAELIAGFTGRQAGPAITTFTFLSGIFLVASMSGVYMMRTVPGWAQAYTPLHFATSTLILGTALLEVTLYGVGIAGNTGACTEMKKYLLAFLCLFIVLDIFTHLLAGPVTVKGNTALVLTLSMMSLLIAAILFFRQVNTGWKWHSGWLHVFMILLILAVKLIQRFSFFLGYSRTGV